MTTQSDAFPTKHSKGNAKKGSNITVASGGYQQSGKNFPNSATPFGNSSSSNPPNVDWNEFQRQFQNPVFSSSNNRGSSKSKSTFNFSNCKVGNIVKTNQPVKIENKHETYEKGAVKKDLTIKGGNFPQANFDGDAKYNNEASNINAGTAAGDQPAVGFVEIDNYPPPFSPEQYLVKLLRSGITSEALQSLLEKKYSLINLAYTIPQNNLKQEKMVEALLTIADSN